jgi:hypothetical protein
MASYSRVRELLATRRVALLGVEFESALPLTITTRVISPRKLPSGACAPMVKGVSQPAAQLS